MEPGDKPVFLPYEQNKKGELEGSLATREQFALLEQFVCRKPAGFGGADILRRGRAQPHCARAEGFKLHVLRLSERVPQGRVQVAVRFMKKVKAEEFWDTLERRKTDG